MVEGSGPPMEQFTRREVLRILELKPRQLAHWERLRLVEPRTVWQEKVYRFSDLITLRTIKQLTENRVPARRLRQALEALRQQLGNVTQPLNELRIVSDGRRLVVEHQGAQLEPLSGQFVLNFETRTLGEKVRVMPERTAEEWFAVALNCEGDPARRREAIEAYRQVLKKRPDWVEAQINLGTLLYEEEEPEEAVKCYRRALALEPANALARFNLGSVLDELGQVGAAREELRQAVRLQPDYADAHYNLALVAEKLGAWAEARRHWKRYLQLDPTSPWAVTARGRLAGPGSELS
ncbi:MAG TPA: tetratricopeptide repeat protein [Candidatus Xenobia bacterium]|nr:tetratricopeptide repeat protein [Candidatus Xenobia bacterium]